MDELDGKLIALLRRDGRMSISDLAGHLGVTRSTVRTRLERLESSGEITGYSVQTRADLGHAPVRGLMMLGITGRGTMKIIARLHGLAQVQEVHTTNGAWDLIVLINAQTLEEFDEVLFAIRNIDGVTTSETNLLLSTRHRARR